jgi:hypothetical protein
MVKRESTSGTGFGAEGPMFKDYKGRKRYASQLQPSIMIAQFFPHLSNRSLTVILMQEINEENATCSFCFIYFQLVDCIVARFITHYRLPGWNARQKENSRLNVFLTIIFLTMTNSCVVRQGLAREGETRGWLTCCRGDSSLLVGEVESGSGGGDLSILIQSDQVINGIMKHGHHVSLVVSFPGQYLLACGSTVQR